MVLTGAGRAFSAGGDLAMIEARAAAGAANGPRGRGAIRDGMRAFYQLFLSVRDLPCPTLAAINGAAIGAGLCVALACDLRIASREAKLGLNFTQLGLHPGMGATWTLPRLVGPARAAELLFSSRVFTGAEAATIGLVNRAVAPAEVLPAAHALAAEFAAAAPLAVRGREARAAPQRARRASKTSSASRRRSRRRASSPGTCTRGSPSVREKRRAEVRGALGAGLRAAAGGGLRRMARLPLFVIARRKAIAAAKKRAVLRGGSA